MFYENKPIFSSDRQSPSMITANDCSEVFRMGFHLEGYYKIDPTGNMDDNIGKPVFCENGWTHILRRMPNGGGKVNTFSIF